MTTNTIQATGGDYATIALWEADTPVDSGTEWRGQLADETFAEKVTIAGGGTTPIILEAQSGTAFDGTESNGPLIDTDDEGGFGVINFGSADITVQDLRIDGSGSGSTHALRTNYASGTHLANRVRVNGAAGRFWDEGTGGALIRAVNCIAHDVEIGCIENNTPDTEFFNCTFIQKETDTNTTDGGLRYAVAKNCAVFHFGGSSGWKDYLNLATSLTNAAHDNSGSSAALDDLVAADVFTDPTAAGGWDLTPVSGEALDGAGTGNSTDSDIPTVDIAGNARSTTAPSIGAFELVAAPSGRIMSSLANNGGLAGMGGIAGKGGGLAG